MPARGLTGGLLAHWQSTPGGDARHAQARAVDRDAHGRAPCSVAALASLADAPHLSGDARRHRSSLRTADRQRDSPAHASRCMGHHAPHRCARLPHCRLAPCQPRGHPHGPARHPSMRPLHGHPRRACPRYVGPKLRAEEWHRPRQQASGRAYAQDCSQQHLPAPGRPALVCKAHHRRVGRPGRRLTGTMIQPRPRP